jgi:hypothetical protein
MFTKSKQTTSWLVVHSSGFRMSFASEQAADEWIRLSIKYNTL